MKSNTVRLQYSIRLGIWDRPKLTSEHTFKAKAWMHNFIVSVLAVDLGDLWRLVNGTALLILIVNQMYTMVTHKCFVAEVLPFSWTSSYRAWLRLEQRLTGCHIFVVMRRVDWDSLVSAPTHHATGMSTELYCILPAQATTHRLTLKSHFQTTCLLETPFVQHISSLIWSITS